MSFNPTQIVGCALWLDAADSTTIVLSTPTTFISQWNDKSGNSRNATGNTGTGTYTNNLINNMPCVQITPTGNMASLVAAGTFSAGFTLFGIFQKTGANGTNDTLLGRTFSTGGRPSPWDALTDNTGTRRLIGDGSNYSALYGGTFSFRTTTPQMWSATVNSSNPNSWLDSVNGTTTTYTLAVVLGGVPTYSDLGIKVWIGTRGDGVTTMTGNIGEIICYNRALVASERQTVEGYLAWKWGLESSLPATHPYYAYSPLSLIANPTELNLINTTFNPGQIVLPSSFTVPGRTLIFKDTTGAFSTNSLTFTVNNSNQRIESALISTINNTRLGWTTMAAGNDNNWYTIGGTVINSLNTSTINFVNLSSPFISTANVLMSSLGLVDGTWRNSTNSIYVQSTFMFYRFGAQSTIISGTRQSFGGSFISLRSPFLPNQISGLQLWLDSADQNTIALSGTSIERWNDKSGNQRNATSVGTIPLTSNINQINTPLISGSANTYFQGNVSITNSTLTAFSVFNMISTTAFAPRVLSLAATGVPDFNNVSSTSAIIMYRGNFGSFRLLELSRTPAIYTTPVLTETIFDGTNNTFYLNGTGATPSSSAGVFNISRYFLGTSPTLEAEGILTGTIGEVMLYNAALTTLQRQQVEGYLAWKWGLVGNLPATHPYKNSPP